MHISSINILIADDDKDDVDLLKEALLDILPSANTILVRNGLAALNYLKINHAPHLVFLDLNMHLKNGIDCLKEIFNLGLLPDTPIIIYSTSTNKINIDAAYEYGASLYIIKPTSLKELKKIIANAIGILGKSKIERVDGSNFILKESKAFPFFN